MPELVVNTWYGLFAPAGVRPEIIRRINGEVVKFMDAPDVKTMLARSGLVPATSTPAEFSAFLRADMEKWARVIRAAGIRMN